MRYKSKLLFGILTLFLLTGCTANYNVEIYNEKVKVNGKVLEANKNKWDEVVEIVDSSPFENSTPSVYEDLVDGNQKFTYRQLIDNQFKLDVTLKPLVGLSKINNPWQLGLKFKRSYKLYGDNSDSLLSVAGPSVCYDNFNVTVDEENNNIIISTSSKNKCFDMYKNLDSITVKLKTNHKVVNSTADEVDLHTYIWKLTRENSNDKPLQITLKRNEYVFNYDNRLVKLVGFSAFLAFIIVLFYKLGIIIYNFKVRRRNKI